MNIIEDILSKITPEELDQSLMDRINRIKSLTLEYQLGTFVGENIINRYLPTLSTHPIHSNNCIQVSDEDFDEHERLEKKWMDRVCWGNFPDMNEENKEHALWDELSKYNKYLDKKYLPEVLLCTFDPIYVENIDGFKQGIADALWNSDICVYSTNLEDIKIYYDEDFYLTYIELKRYDED